MPKRGDEYDPADQLEGFKDAFVLHHKYVTGMPKAELPEFSHVLLDSSNLPTREVRGWRSVLMALIKADALTYRQVVRQFGEPNGARANRWFQDLREFKAGIKGTRK